jgi:hypothetical protein
MAIDPHSPHRWWISLVTIAGAMAAAADASAREMPGKGTHDVACGATLGVSDTRSPAVHVLDKGRIVTPGRSTQQMDRCARLRIDAELWEDRIDEDDDSDLPARFWFREMVRSLHDLIVCKCGSRIPFNSAHSTFSRLSQQLRC